MKNVLVPILTLVACGFGAYADSNMQPTAQPSTCYITYSAGAAQMTCLNENSEATPLQAVAVSMTDSNSGVLIEKDLSLSVKGAVSVADVYGSYILTLNDPEQKILVMVSALDGNDLTSLVRGGGGRGGGGGARGGGGYRGGRGYRGGGVAYRGRGAIVGGAIVGGAVGAAAAGAYGSSYCDPNYSDCGGGYYGGGGYYPGAGVAAGAVVGGAIAAGRRGAVGYRGGGARVGHYGGGARGGGGRRR